MKRLLSLYTIIFFAWGSHADPFYMNAASGVQPRLEYALEKEAEGMAVYVGVGSTPGAVRPARLQVGFAGTKAVAVNVDTVALPVDSPRRPGVVSGAKVLIPWEKLGEVPSDSTVRLAVHAEWSGADPATPVRVETYLCQGAQSNVAKLGRESVANWSSINLEEYRREMEDLQSEIAFDVKQPMDGRYSVVIENASGKRVRNLISGEKAVSGTDRIVWDGLDEDGNLVPAGEYRWRAVHHPGIRAEYLGMYANGRYDSLDPFSTNHGNCRDACVNSRSYFVAAPLAEGGYAVIRYDANGNWIAGYNFPHGTPLGAAVVAADEEFLYAANWGADTSKDQQNARHNPDWAGPHFVTLTRFDVESRRVVRFPGKPEFHRVFEYEASRRDPATIFGLALLGDRLYVACRAAGGLLVFDKTNGDALGKIEIAEVGDVAVSGNELVVISGSSVVRVDPATERQSVVVKPTKHVLTGLSTAPDGRIFVTDQTDHQILAYSPKGKLVKRYGSQPGGPYAGPYVASRLVNPLGTAVFQNRLIVTEQRHQPKRFLQFDLDSGAVVDERFGNPPYGGSAGGFDAKDATRWVGMGCEWKIDPQQKDRIAGASPTSVFFKEGGHFGGYYEWAYRYRYEHVKGRTFLVGSGFIQTISERLADGSLRDVAAFAAIGCWRYGCGWKPPQAFTDALKAAGIEDPTKGQIGGRGVLWADQNGDGICQAEEFDVLDVDWGCPNTRWGINTQGLDFTFGVTVEGGTNVLVNLAPSGWRENGTAIYPKLRDAIAAAPRIEAQMFKQNVRCEAMADRFGRVLYNADPWMQTYSLEGKLLWRFPNKWVGVHGSHNAPLPETGVMQGNNFFLGSAPLDEHSDVTVLNGNHGRYFYLTSDGFYLDETFRDVRMGGARDDQYVGGEPFGGFFAKGNDGHYYLQTGGGGFRIYDIHGLDNVQRSSGTFEVTGPQLAAADRIRAAKFSRERQERTASIGKAPADAAVDGRSNEWRTREPIAWDRQGQFPVRVWLGFSGDHLHLTYEVRDDSPWVNNGVDWQSLFKTGDSVDLQLGAHPSAKAGRKEPVPGDLRLLIAPFAGKSIAVLYRHRLRPEEKGEKVTFTSPWRSETVDDVRILENAKIVVNRAANAYVLEARIPLDDLGWEPRAGMNYRADLGVIYGDRDGTINLMRSYWSNEATGLVNDVPGEIMLNPSLWGTFTIGEL